MFVGRENEIDDNIKVMTRLPCISPIKENFILEVSGGVFAELIRRGRTIVNILSCHVEEYEDVMRCHKCCAFGHVIKNCREKALTCHKCGGEGHVDRECRSEERDCPNCRRAKRAEESRGHSAGDRCCPVYKRKIEELREKMDYGQ